MSATTRNLKPKEVSRRAPKPKAQKRKAEQIRKVRDYLALAVAHSAEEMPITAEHIAKQIAGVRTRTTLYNWGLKEEIQQAKAEQERTAAPSPAAAEKRALEDIIAARDEVISQLREANERLLAWWNLVEYNARELAINPEDLLRPMPVPPRQKSRAGQKANRKRKSAYHGRR